MKKLMQDIELYAHKAGIKPATVLYYALNANSRTWGKWQAGGSCTFRIAEKLRSWMADNPPKRGVA